MDKIKTELVNSIKEGKESGVKSHMTTLKKEILIFGFSFWI